MKQPHSNWIPAFDAWQEFVKQHPQLGFTNTYWGLHNFLRSNRQRLAGADIIRKARNKFWLADTERFSDAVFAIATGKGQIE